MDPWRPHGSSSPQVFGLCPPIAVDFSLFDLVPFRAGRVANLASGLLNWQAIPLI